MYITHSPSSQEVRTVAETRKGTTSLRSSLVAKLRECGSRKDLRWGKHLHSKAIEAGCHKNKYVGPALISMYSKCCRMQDAQEVFDTMSQHNVFSWTALILGYVENGESSVALDLFNSMNCEPDSFTFAVALKACEDLQKGVGIHRQAREHGFDKDVFVANTLVDMYSRCGSMLHAQDVFDGILQRNTVSWTSLIRGYVENGESLIALEIFNNMDCAVNRVTFVAALKACVRLDKNTCLENGVSIHRKARERGFDKDIFVGSALIEMYSKCGDMTQARRVFERMTLRDVISWTALIHGYVENGESSVGLAIFNSMDCEPDRVTFVAALKACASLGALEFGQRIHDRVCALGLQRDATVANSLVDFYGKCGKMDAAEEVFSGMYTKDIVSWTALIGGYTLLGNASRVFSLVKRMQETGLQINSVTMLLILTTCSQVGMVEEGEDYFKSMSKHGISPSVEHYMCMIDMLGRVNRLQEALSLVNSMAVEDSRVWMTLLAACRKWSNLEIGKAAFHALMNKNDKEHIATAYVCMRNIYESLGMQEDVLSEAGNLGSKSNNIHPL